MGTDSSSNTDVRELLHRLRSTLARLKGELELAELDGHPFAPNVLESMTEVLELLSGVEEAWRNQDPGVVRPVFVVDDDWRLAQVTARRLRALGWTCYPLSDLPAVAATDAIWIVDWGVLSAAEPEKASRALLLSPIVVSGLAHPEIADRALRHGARAFLVKPVDYQQLDALIRAEQRATRQ